MDRGSEHPDRKHAAFYNDRSRFPFLDDDAYREMLALDEMGSRANLIRSAVRTILTGERQGTVAHAIAGLDAIAEARRHVEKARQGAADESDRAFQSEFGQAIDALREYAPTHPAALDIPAIAVIETPADEVPGRDDAIEALQASNIDILSELDRLRSRVDALEEARVRAGDPSEALDLHARFEEEKRLERESDPRRAQAEAEAMLIPEEAVPARRMMLRMTTALARRRRELAEKVSRNGMTNLMRRADIAIRTHAADLLASKRLARALDRSSSRLSHAMGIGVLGLVAVALYRHPDTQKMLAELFPSAVDGSVPDVAPVRETFPGTGVHDVRETAPGADTIPHPVPNFSLSPDDLDRVSRGGFSSLVRLPALQDTLLGTFPRAAQEQLAWILRDTFEDDALWRALITFTDGVSMSPGTFPAAQYIRGLNLSVLADERVIESIRAALAENPERYAKLIAAIEQHGGDIGRILSTR